MSRKKKRKALPPRVKRMSRPARLQSARTWLPTYAGKNTVRGYRKHFGVDWACAFKELEMLGVKVEASFKARTLESVVGQIAARKRRKAQRKATYEEPLFEQNEYFAYIAGYTPAGFAYGITWEEWEQLEQKEMMESAGVSSAVEEEVDEPAPLRRRAAKHIDSMGVTWGKVRESGAVDQ